MVCSKAGNNDVLRRALDFEVVERKGRGRPKTSWKKVKTD